MHPFLLVPFALSALLVIALTYTLVLGGRQADDGIARPRHLFGANWTVGLTAAVGASMVAAHYLGALPHVNPTVLKIHLYCIGIYIALVVLMRYVVPGTRFRSAHIALGCVMIPTFAIAAIAGGIMFGQIMTAVS